MLLPSLAIVAVLLVVSAFFSGSETALTAVSRGRMHQLEKDGSRAARNVNRLVANRERLIGALLLGNTFINILASSLMTAALENQLGPRAVAVTTGVMTLVILIFAEVLPKHSGDRSQPTVSPSWWRRRCAALWRSWLPSWAVCNGWCGVSCSSSA